MAQNIIIEIPEGKEAKQVTNPDGSISITFVDKEPIHSKSWEEFCKNHYEFEAEWYIDSNCIIRKANGVRGATCNNFLQSKEDAEGILALIQLTRLHDEWVGDWKPNDQAYSIYWHNSENCQRLTYGIQKLHHLLQFPDAEMAYSFLKHFEDLIEKAKKFI